MAGEKVATYAINLDGNAAEIARKDIAELEQLKAKIEASQNAMKGLSQSLRSLKGSSDEVAKAKTELKARIDVEKGAVTQSTLALLKHGTSLQQVTASMKKATVAEKEQTASIATLKEGLGAMLSPIGLAAAAIVGIGAAASAAAVKLGEFIVSSADQLRSMGLVREAATGSAEDAAALGTQVDDLSHRVATSKDHLNELGSAIARNLSGGMSRASGQAIEDTFYAVSESAAAMGDSVGSTLQGLVERGKTWNRFSLAPQDLDKTQLQFQEVAQSLAKNLGIGLDAAKARLFRGQVSLEQGAKALRDAVEVRFGEVNSKKLLSLDVQLAKLKESFTSLSAGVVPLLEPILKGLSHVLELFDDTTSSGETLKGIFTFLGDAIGAIAPDVFDELKIGIEEAEGAGLDLLLWLKGMNDDLKDYGGFWGIAKESMSAAVEVAKVAIAPFKLLAEAIGAYVHYAGMLGVNAAGESTKELGVQSSAGFAAGISSGKEDVANAARELAKAAERGYVDYTEIQSPSKLFQRYGEQTSAGAAIGIERGADDVQSAADSMAPSPAAGSSGGGGGGASAPIIVNIVLPESMGQAKAAEVAKSLNGGAFLGQLTKALREALVGAGVPTQAAGAP